MNKKEAQPKTSFFSGYLFLQFALCITLFLKSFLYLLLVFLYGIVL
ncbi:hypothetical protein RU85_GL000523 [Lactococcus garvieae]|nr:hypothetical protein RU85_GL000523 [Lactococcus garvieae]